MCIRDSGKEHAVDARPSDALAFAVRVNAPIYVEDDIMNRAGTFSYQTDTNDEAEQQKFDEFVHTLSPEMCIRDRTRRLSTASILLFAS